MSFYTESRKLGPRPAEIYQQIIKDIYSARLLPGDPVTEWDPSRNVSQATRRAAIIELERLHLVTREQHRRATVVNLDHKQMQELIDVRIPLDSLACKLARPKLMRPKKFAKAEKRADKISEALGDQEFHLFIWRNAGNDLLLVTLAEICAPMFAFNLLLRRKGLQDTSQRIHSHRDFLGELVRPDASADDIDRLVNQHIRDAYDAFLTSSCKTMQEVANLPDVEVEKSERGLT